jgi:sulfotransferase
MSGEEAAPFITDGQRKTILRSVIEGYYSDCQSPVIFDSCRMWTALLTPLCSVYPAAKVVCCVRSPAWIIDSMECLIHKNALLASRPFGMAQGWTDVYTRAMSMMKDGPLGPAWHGLRQAWYSELGGQLILVPYDVLVREPESTVGKLYQLLGEKPFRHDFDNIEYDEPRFDAALNMPGLHRVGRKVEAAARTSILPPDLFAQHDLEFWNEPGENPRGAVVL